eukprot:CAMPEP_0119300744 /NCGR_PEP_ID=MMETSP1333-20130426/2652_1 /TAXON_ID=418940 /ORGANISM="Scyphosphaera apsteinii, Strain RCC1455" /LENGTH=152 /DNA_ID=CAMNT_0007302631 /DNA_START=209 /DNA_END=667 /DNA_ORIENTATION=+
MPKMQFAPSVSEVASMLMEADDRVPQDIALADAEKMDANMDGTITRTELDSSMIQTFPSVAARSFSLISSACRQLQEKEGMKDMKKRRLCGGGRSSSSGSSSSSTSRSSRSGSSNSGSAETVSAPIGPIWDRECQRYIESLRISIDGSGMSC